MMWRIGFLAFASCSLISTSVQASGPTGTASAPPPGTRADGAQPDPEYGDIMHEADKAPAKLPPTLTPPDVAAPAVVMSKGPFTLRGSHVTGHNVFLPISRSPASPWAGVSKTAPVKVKIDAPRWWIRDETLQCTAAIDHCLPAYSWFWVRNEIDPSPSRNAYPVVFTTEGPKRPGPLADGNSFAFTAYRSVPATKKNLVAGVRVFAFPEAPLPTGTDGVYDRWQMGIVDRVEWELGMVFLKTMEQPFFISAARVAVLSYEPDAGVKILDGKKRDELAVNAADVVVP